MTIFASDVPVTMTFMTVRVKRDATLAALRQVDPQRRRHKMPFFNMSLSTPLSFYSIPAAWYTTFYPMRMKVLRRFFD